MSKATQQARAARLAEADATIDATLARLANDRPAPDDWPHWFSELARLALDELDGWALWHLGRGDDRAEQAEALGLGLLPLDGGSEALGGVIDAASLISTAIAEGVPPGDLAEHIDGLHRAIALAKHRAERDCLAFDDDLGAIAEGQADELETSHLLGWARSLAAILHAWAEAQAEPATGHHWLTSAALGLVFDGQPRAGRAEA